MQDTNVTLKLKLLRLDISSGGSIQSQGIPMAPHSGAALPNVALPSGHVLMHAIFIVDNKEVYICVCVCVCVYIVYIVRHRHKCMLAHTVRCSTHSFKT